MRAGVKQWILRTVITLVVILIVLIVVACYLLVVQDRQASETGRNLRSVKLGMTKEEVIRIMGEPINRDEYMFKGKRRETWYYLSPTWASTLNSCAFDVNTGKVTDIWYADDETHIKDSP